MWEDRESRKYSSKINACDISSASSLPINTTTASAIAPTKPKSTGIAAPRSCERRTTFMRAMCDAWTAIFHLTTIAKPMSTATSNGREKPEHRKVTKDEMVEWFKSAPRGSRHDRMFLAPRHIVHLTGAT